MSILIWFCRPCDPDRARDPGGFRGGAGQQIAMIGEGAPPAGREAASLGRGDDPCPARSMRRSIRCPRRRGRTAASTAAAAAGGVTTIVDVPMTKRSDRLGGAVGHKAATVGCEARVDSGRFASAIDPTEGPARIAEQAEAGVAAFKFSTFGTDQKRFPRVPPALPVACFAEVARPAAAGVRGR